MRTAASGRLGGGQGDSAQAQQLEEGGGLPVELTQLSLRPRQVGAAGNNESHGGGYRTSQSVQKGSYRAAAINARFTSEHV